MVANPFLAICADLYAHLIATVVNFETDRAAFKKLANEPWNQPLC